MNNNTKRQRQRESLTSDILQQVQNEVEDVLLQEAPDQWAFDGMDKIEETVLAHTRLELDALRIDELRAPGALQRHIANAKADTRQCIHLRMADEM